MIKSENAKNSDELVHDVISEANLQSRLKDNLDMTETENTNIISGAYTSAPTQIITPSRQKRSEGAAVGILLSPNDYVPFEEERV